MAKKPKILYIYDVPNWGAHVRAMYSKKYLSDEFEIATIDERSIHKNYWRKYKGYDLYYLMFHTMLAKGGFVSDLPEGKIISIVTQPEVLKPIFGKDEKIAKKKWNVVTKSCAAMFANNYFSLENLKKLYKGPTFMIPRGVDETIFTPKQPYNKRLDRFYTCFVGKAHEERKGFHSFIYPASEATDSYMLLNIRTWVSAVNQQEMAKLYNKCNVYLVASTVDGTPNPMLEAAACGRPIIANKIGNSPEFIKDGVNGFLVDLDLKEYIDKINWMKNNLDKAEKMGQKARETVEGGWTWKHVTDIERNALKTILDKKK